MLYLFKTFSVLLTFFFKSIIDNQVTAFILQVTILPCFPHHMMAYQHDMVQINT